MNEIHIIILIILLSLIMVFTFPLVNALVFEDILLDPEIDWPDNTYAMKMCKILPEDPFYDCNVTWIMIYLPDTELVNIYCYKEQSVMLGWGVVGCAFIPINMDEESSIFIIGSQHGEKSHTGQSVLQHELKHMVCKCD